MQAVGERKYVWICLYHANAPFKIFVIHIHGWLHIGVWETEHNSKYARLINSETESHRGNWRLSSLKKRAGNQLTYWRNVNALYEMDENVPVALSELHPFNSLGISGIKNEEGRRATNKLTKLWCWPKKQVAIEHVRMRLRLAWLVAML